MNEQHTWRPNAPSQLQPWRNTDIPLPPPERQAIPSLMDSPDIVECRKQIEEFRQKIVDSEQNLQAHKNGMDDLLMVHLKSAIRSAENMKIERLLSQQNLNVDELNSHLEAMSSSKCSKDLISQAKKWIFEYCVNDQLREIILTFLLNKVKDESAGEYLRLHILYLINDWAFHCQRKKEENQMKMLARYVPKMYAYCIELSSSSELNNKLEGKLLGEWEGRGYFADSVFKQLRNTVQIVNTDREIERSSYASVRESIRSNLAATFEAYEQQHVTYSQHVQTRIDELERKIDELRHGPSSHPSQNALHGPPSSMRRSRFDQAPNADPSFSANAQDTWRVNDKPVDGEDIDGMPFDEDNLKPQKSYLALPAGIMTPLVTMNSFKYAPLDPDELEMPASVLPSSRLLAAKNMFHKGIEIDMIVAEVAVADDISILKYPKEFLEEKAKAKKAFLDKYRTPIDELIVNKPSASDQEMFDKERRLKEEGQIAKIRSCVDAYYATQEPPENLREDSPRGNSPSRSPSRSERRSFSRSRSPSPRRRRRSSSSSSRSSDSSSGSSSSSRKSSPERGRNQGFHSRGFGGEFSDRPSFGVSKPTNEPLSFDNKGAQLMAKMGWTSGKGLGSNESGIVNPISGGEVRDRNEQFKGLGRSLDPYEQFRKQRSGTYHDRNPFHRK